VSIGVDNIPSIATGIGVFLAAYQLRQAKRTLREGFERSFVERYERIIAGIDLEIILQGASPDLTNPTMRRAFFDYFELCEEELYFRSYRRVSTATWRDWWYGIRLHLQNDAFVNAFSNICEQANDGGSSRRAPTRFDRLSIAVEFRSTPHYEPSKAGLKQRLW
jgi:hypothetical protein